MGFRSRRLCSDRLTSFDFVLCLPQILVSATVNMASNPTHFSTIALVSPLAASLELVELKSVYIQIDDNIVDDLINDDICALFKRFVPVLIFPPFTTSKSHGLEKIRLQRTSSVRWFGKTQTLLPLREGKR